MSSTGTERKNSTTAPQTQRTARRLREPAHAEDEPEDAGEEHRQHRRLEGGPQAREQVLGPHLRVGDERAPTCSPRAGWPSPSCGRRTTAQPSAMRTPTTVSTACRRRARAPARRRGRARRSSLHRQAMGEVGEQDPEGQGEDDEAECEEEERRQAGSLVLGDLGDRPAASAVPRTTAATVVFLMRAMRVDPSGAMEPRNACGRRTSRRVWAKVRPIARAASAWPAGMVLTPLRRASQTNAAW